MPPMCSDSCDSVEEDRLADIDDEPVGVCGNCDRVCSAAKATAMFCAICALLLVIGLVRSSHILIPAILFGRVSTLRSYSSSALLCQ
jgi:hypothetical protein